MSRIGGILSSILTGAQTVLSQLAQHFRLGPYGGTSPPQQAQPGRVEAATPQEIVQRITEQNLTPPQTGTPRYSERYICVYTDEDSGEVLARVPMQVEYDEGTARSTRYSRARRAAGQLLRSDRGAAYTLGMPGDLGMRNVRTNCRRTRGGPIQIGG